VIDVVRRNPQIRAIRRTGQLEVAVRRIVRGEEVCGDPQRFVARNRDLALSVEPQLASRGFHRRDAEEVGVLERRVQREKSHSAQPTVCGICQNLVRHRRKTRGRRVELFPPLQLTDHPAAHLDDLLEGPRVQIEIRIAPDAQLEDHHVGNQLDLRDRRIPHRQHERLMVPVRTHEPQNGNRPHDLLMPHRLLQRRRNPPHAITKLDDRAVRQREDCLDVLGVPWPII